MGLTDYSFTPSEYIFLNGEKFAPAADGHDGLSLLCTDIQVDGHFLAVEMMMAAILANEFEGALEIEIRERKKNLFGSGGKKEVFLNVVRLAPNWSGYTLESAVMFNAGNLRPTQQNSLLNIIIMILAENLPVPWKKVIDLVEGGLASSNWLIPVGGGAAGAFSTPFICPGHVRKLVLEQPSEPITGLLTGCKQHHPGLWELMKDEIERAMNECRSG